MLKVGDRAPDFDLTESDGRTRRLSDVLREGSVLVYFYPSDFTPVCSRQACMFRDSHDRLASAGIRVVGISPQGGDSHGRFREKLNLPFPLVTDADWAISKAYGAKGILGMKRVTFLVGSDGAIQDVVRAGLRVGAHADLVERTLARLDDHADTG